jgi:hypothetical protein
MFSLGGGGVGRAATRQPTVALQSKACAAQLQVLSLMLHLHRCFWIFVSMPVESKGQEAISLYLTMIMAVFTARHEPHSPLL